MENLISELGRVEGESIESANIDYEGMKVKSIRKIRYDNFDAVFYQLDNSREIFGYLEPHQDHSFKHFRYGMVLSEIIDLNGSHVQRWENTFVIYSSFMEFDVSMLIKTNDDLEIVEIQIDIGAV